ncbi:MAG: hypothetical protein PHQ60_14450 [Sideroxydans sp.]|nr:hypothetical protein [Sideroxydans sp.]
MKKLLLMAILVVPFFTLTLLTQAQAAPASGVVAATTMAASGDTGQTNQTLYDILFTYLAISIIFEVALHPVFNWSIFMKRFDGKGLKTPITVITAFIVFQNYDMDIIRDVLNAQHIDGSTTHSLAAGGKFLTALLIAGGSAGVLQIFRKLGIRPPEAERSAQVAKLKDEAAKAKAKPKEQTGDTPA